MATVDPAVQLEAERQQPSTPDSPADRYRAASRLDALDGLRAVASALVVGHHCAGNVVFFNRSIGVTLFFVMSGYLITRMVIREKGRTGTVAVGSFLARRALRTFPLYYAILAVYVVLVTLLERGTTAGAEFWARLPWFATFTSNWLGPAPESARVIFYFAWSLAVQEQFYLIWPLVLRHARRRWAAVLPLVLLVAPHVAWLGSARSIAAGLSSPIYLGALLAIALENRRAFSWAHRIAGQAWSVPAAALVLFAPAFLSSEPAVVVELAACYLVAACALSSGPAVRPLRLPAVMQVGRVSYGVYLLHMLVLHAVQRLLPHQGALVVFVPTFGIAIGLALASFRWFERPIMRLRAG